MTRRVVVLAVLATVVLAGCMGGPGADPTETGPTEDRPDDASNAAVPGVTNGTLSNATALARANVDALQSEGGAVSVDWDTATTDATFQLVLGSGFDTYTLSGAPGSGPGGAAELSLWSNETERVIRTTAGENVSYRTVDRRSGTPNALESVEDYLAAGTFTVGTETGPNGTVVLTADAFESPPRNLESLANASDASARLVVDESGLIHNLTVHATTADGTHDYRYLVERTGIDRADRPAWLDDVPPAATLNPQVRVDVENESVLAVRNEGGDSVPANTTLSLTANGTSGQATFETAIAADDTRYAYFEAATGDLVIADERPSADAVDPLESPVSVEVASAGGASYYSGGMAWETGSASESQSGSSSEDTAAGGDSEGGASGSSSEMQSEASAES